MRGKNDHAPDSSSRPQVRNRYDLLADMLSNGRRLDLVSV